jgi:hypothetical protein
MLNTTLNTPAPDISLNDFHGLKNDLLVFNRGFVGPFLSAHMGQLRQDFEKFQDKNTILPVVEPEEVHVFVRYLQENNHPPKRLLNPKHSGLKQYGQEIKLFKFGRIPAMGIVDMQGMVRFVHDGHSMFGISKNTDFMAALQIQNQENG